MPKDSQGSSIEGTRILSLKEGMNLKLGATEIMIRKVLIHSWMFGGLGWPFGKSEPRENPKYIICTPRPAYRNRTAYRNCTGRFMTPMLLIIDWSPDVDKIGENNCVI